LVAADADGTRWSLPVKGTVFSPLLRETRFEIQVIDQDGLQLESPLRGAIRIKADRPPLCAGGVVHRVVLPTAKPVIEYRVNDDYGIAGLVLQVQVERGQNGASATDRPVGAETSPSGESSSGQAPQPVELSAALPLIETPPILLTDRLPYSSRYELDLASLQVVKDGRPVPAALVKGDRLKLTLQATDYRGDLAGESYLSEPLVLEISDESGVLSAISEADQRSEERLEEIIKQQLGIGGSP
jgi:hypothetical protein